MATVVVLAAVYVAIVAGERWLIEYGYISAR
jgi:hypothetical protein